MTTQFSRRNIIVLAVLGIALVLVFGRYFAMTSNFSKSMKGYNKGKSQAQEIQKKQYDYILKDK